MADPKRIVDFETVPENVYITFLTPIDRLSWEYSGNHINYLNVFNKGHLVNEMADRLAKIFGTEEDRVNCPFYFKLGACRNGDYCNRRHNRPIRTAKGAADCFVWFHFFRPL